MRPATVILLALSCLPLASACAPRVAPAAAEVGCELGWDELAAAAPRELPLTPWRPGAPLPDPCPPDLDVAALLAAPPGDDAVRADVGGGRLATLVADGPGGSGRFWGVVVAVPGDPPRVACALASTAGFRHLLDRAAPLTPLPWLADLDGDGAAEVILWHRLPLGPAASEACYYGAQAAGAVHRRPPHRLPSSSMLGAPMGAPPLSS
ncbi:MAG: hypothetical protein H6745_00820 [Deltaproteobacteria bacterium]|nr:hypothetical protein [Deltaproteobacteria bacterium]